MTDYSAHINVGASSAFALCVSFQVKEQTFTIWKYFMTSLTNNATFIAVIRLNAFALRKIFLATVEHFRDN